MPYRKYYNLESYLFKEVGPRFRSTGKLSHLDLYFVLHWKARRAKSHAMTRLTKRAGAFNTAAKQIAKAIYEAKSPRDRLQVLMCDWGFKLPTATAILSVLYPRVFTIYDVRVCEQLKKFGNIGNWKFSDRLWEAYLAFIDAVRSKVPAKMSLRDKDRYLWGKSLYETSVANSR